MKKFWQYLKILLLLGLLYFQLIYWHNFYIGLLFVICYLLFVGSLWQTILRRVLAIENRTWLNKFLSIFVVFTMLGVTSGIFIVFYKLTSFTLWLCYLLTALLSFILFKLFNKRVKEHEASDDEELILFKKNIIYYLSFIIYFVLWSVALYLLFRSQSAIALQSPWQVISKNYLPIFFGLTFLSGIFLFVRFKTKTILLILVLQSLLLHFYLPLSHQNPWGGDVWRHVAVEERIAGGEQIWPLVSAQKLSYGHLWGTSVLLSKTLNVDLLTVNKWLMLVLWSLVAPFLFFRIGCLVFDSRRKGLWFAWLSLLPFPLQALGGLALPVSFDFLLFLFVFMFWLQYWRDRYRSQKRLALLFSALLIFGYSLYAILMWSIIILSFIIYLLGKEERRKRKVAMQILLVFASIFIIPAIELIAKISYIPQNINLWQNIKQAIGQFSGWFYASAIRPHDILSGNIIFNHTPDYTFVASVFNNWRWWLIPAMLVLWLFVGLGAYRIFKTKDLRFKIIGFLFFSVFGGYLFGWFVLGGDRLLTRRLDMILALLILILFIYGLSFIIYHLSNSKYQIAENKYQITSKAIVILLVFGLAWFTVFTYASGPDLRVVSADEYIVAKYIIDHRSQITDHECVLADTWVLLPLETLSAGKIVGGGFPIDYQFSQPERTVLFNEMMNNPRESVLKLAHEKTGAEVCWFVSGVRNSAFVPSSGREEFRVQTSEVFGLEPVKFGSLLVWKEAASTPVAAPLKK